MVLSGSANIDEYIEGPEQPTYQTFEFTACKGQKTKNVFKIHLPDGISYYVTSSSPGQMGTLTLQSELEGKVEAPYLEIQWLDPKDDRIPLYRTRDELCRPDILTCPASFSTIEYTDQVCIPSGSNNMDSYKLRLVFREFVRNELTDLGCFETIVPLNKTQWDN